jgi:hypothetical protein
MLDLQVEIAEREDRKGGMVRGIGELGFKE